MNEIKIANVTKYFGNLAANDNVSLEIEKGEIHAIVGENGAGKSTLMRVLTGIYQPNQGTISIKGQEVQIRDTRIARNLGIGMVHQHFSLISSLSVTENIVLSGPPSKFGSFRKKKAEEMVKELSAQFGLPVEPDALVENCRVGIRQRVEILKALYGGTDILILDEPTAVLSPQETESLLDTLQNFSQKGKTIVFITHKLREVMAGADRVTVMRNGKTFPAIDVSQTTAEELADKMVGRKVGYSFDKISKNVGNIVLLLENICAEDIQRVEKLRNISFEVRRGEVVGIAGVEGNGQSELAEIITGLRRAQKGMVQIEGAEVTKSLNAKNARSMGVVHIPEDRMGRGLANAASLRDNLIMGHYNRKPISDGMWINAAEANTFSENIVKENDIRPGEIHAFMDSLSGGNMQKAIVARELFGKPRLIVAVQPTRGVDIGAAEFVYQRLIKHLDHAGIILISSDLDEILTISDRILVMFKGEIIGGGYRDELSVQDIGLMMTGVKDNQEEIEKDTSDTEKIKDYSENL
jgi:general nucleoside transport system ATP-binding protein